MARDDQPTEARRAVRREAQTGGSGVTWSGTEAARAHAHDPAGRTHTNPPARQAYTVSDAEAVGACASLLDDHRVLVEPACGAALALAYSPRQREALRRFETVVVVVCGGGGVTHEILSQWKADLL